jgi:hypothetical protein
MSTCNYQFKHGKECKKTIFNHDKCLKHSLLHEPVTIDGKTTCKHKFLGGERDGYYCPKISESGGYCLTHSCIQTSMGAGIAHCKYQFTTGNREGFYCPQDVASNNGYCWSHYVSCVGLKQPHVSDDHTFVESPTCLYRFIGGDRSGLYCPGLARKNGYCNKHSEKVNSNLNRISTCPHVIRTGPNKGHICGKPGSNEGGWCNKHVYYADRCNTVRTVIIKKEIVCSRKLRDGHCSDPQCERYSA